MSVCRVTLKKDLCPIKRANIESAKQLENIMILFVVSYVKILARKKLLQLSVVIDPKKTLDGIMPRVGESLLLANLVLKEVKSGMIRLQK